MLTTIFSSFGAAIGLSRPNSFISAGSTSLTYLSRMRAVARLFALGRAGLPLAASAATSTCSGLAFLPWGFPSARLGALFFFSSALFLLYLSHGFGSSPVREVVNFDPSTPLRLSLRVAQDERSRLKRLENALIFPASSCSAGTPAHACRRASRAPRAPASCTG